MTDIPSIHALRARLQAIVQDCAADMGDNFCARCEGHRETIRVLDAVVPLLREHQNCVDDRLDEKGMEPTERAGWVIDDATLEELLAGEGGAT